MHGTLKKLPNLTAFLEIFLYLKSNDSVEHYLCYSFISKVKYSFHTASGWSGFSVLPFYVLKWNCNFWTCEILPNFSCHFWKQVWVLLQILHQSSVPTNIIPLYFFRSNIIYFRQKQPIKEQIFETFECLGQNSSNSSC